MGAGMIRRCIPSKRSECIAECGKATSRRSGPSIDQLVKWSRRNLVFYEYKPARMTVCLCGMLLINVPISTTYAFVTR
ncbi:Urease accessory protein UreG [Dirofilaria immitis]